MKITINTDINAPCCPCEIVAEDGRSILVQTDWDCPGFAQTFGWSLRQVQKCHECGKLIPVPEGMDLSIASKEEIECEDCGHKQHICHHDATDGTVDCKECGVTAGEFIAAAYDFLVGNNGLTVENSEE